MTVKPAKPSEALRECYKILMNVKLHYLERVKLAKILQLTNSIIDDLEAKGE